MNILAYAYGIFDAMRVTDKTAGAAIEALKMETYSTIDPKKVNKINEHLEVYCKKGSKEKAKLCSDLKSIGFPTYYPDYMILHGTRAFRENPYENAIKKDFNAEQTWNDLLKNFHCTNL